jgi:hypothetical protein
MRNWNYQEHEGKKLKVKFTLEQAMNAQRGSICLAVLFL